jgi:hypothetical protein
MMPRKTMKRNPATSEKVALLKVGMTSDEIAIWHQLAAAAGRMLQLPVLHPMEQHETAHDFHKLQLRLLARPGLRAAGWPRPVSEQSSARID